MQTAQTNLIRKQFLISESQIKKLDRLVKSTKVQGGKTSAAKIVKNAIDAYNPDDATDDLEASELIGLVHTRLQEAIKATKKANRVVAAGLKKLSERTIAIDKRVVRLETLVEVARSQPSNLAITE